MKLNGRPKITAALIIVNVFKFRIMIKKLTRLLCKIGIHDWLEHTHKTQEGEFYCSRCGKYMDEEEMQKYL